jgi:hypothetical protein
MKRKAKPAFSTPISYFRNAARWQAPEVQRKLDLFVEATGEWPRSLLELERWAASPEGLAAIADDESS